MTMVKTAILYLHCNKYCYSWPIWSCNYCCSSQYLGWCGLCTARL